MQKIPYDIVYCGTQYYNIIESTLKEDYNFYIRQIYDLKKYVLSLSMLTMPAVFLIEVGNNRELALDLLKTVKENIYTSGSIVILLGEKRDKTLIHMAISYGAKDIYFRPFIGNDIAERINFLIHLKLIEARTEELNEKHIPFKISFVKRTFDILAASILILLLSPALIVIALAVRIESKGPIIYKSKRAGSGYKIFDFYKFRSMVADAEKKLGDLSKEKNQYNDDETNSSGAFIKILNDPRITKVGSFIRKTSIDELPQLFNVLKGDMSIVGNRPLPLYEAELLTSDQFAMRFLGPAGITGLWQISKRGKAKMSESERKELDNYYATYSSFTMDMKIILKTIPAVLQKEKV